MSDAEAELSEALIALMNLLDKHGGPIKPSANLLQATERVRIAQDHVLGVVGSLEHCPACRRPF